MPKHDERVKLATCGLAKIHPGLSVIWPPTNIQSLAPIYTTSLKDAKSPDFAKQLQVELKPVSHLDF